MLLLKLRNELAEAESLVNSIKSMQTSLRSSIDDIGSAEELSAICQIADENCAQLALQIEKSKNSLLKDKVCW